MFKLILSTFVCLALGMTLSAVEVVDLRCEYRPNPAGLDTLEPRLGWIIATQERGVFQAAYQIRVASTPKLLKQDHADLWDSGKVLSDESVSVPYAGVPLPSRAECFWKVRVWDQAGKV